MLYCVVHNTGQHEEAWKRGSADFEIYQQLGEIRIKDLTAKLDALKLLIMELDRERDVLDKITHLETSMQTSVGEIRVGMSFS